MRFKSVNWIYSILICQASLRQLASMSMKLTRHKLGKLCGDSFQCWMVNNIKTTFNWIEITLNRRITMEIRLQALLCFIHSNWMYLLYTCQHLCVYTTFEFLWVKVQITSFWIHHLAISMPDYSNTFDIQPRIWLIEING